MAVALVAPSVSLYFCEAEPCCAAVEDVAHSGPNILGVKSSRQFVLG